MLYGKGLEGMSRTAGGLRRGAPTADRNKVEALIPTDRKLRESLRGQWNSPSRSMNTIPLRLVEEHSKKEYYVIGWGGGNTIVTMHEGRIDNMSLTTLARRGVKRDFNWNPGVTLGEVLQGRNIPAPVLDESKLEAQPNEWIVCRGTDNLIQEGKVVTATVWRAYRNSREVPVTMLPVAKAVAESREEAIRVVQEQDSKGANVVEQNPHTNYSSRRGGVQSLNEMLGL